MLYEYQEHTADEYFLKSKEGEELGVGVELIYFSEFFRKTLPGQVQSYV